ncbi:hypothetical protein GCM10018952_43280 [Streptosporangium vulgare]
MVMDTSMSTVSDDVSEDLGRDAEAEQWGHAGVAEVVKAHVAGVGGLADRSPSPLEVVQLGVPRWDGKTKPCFS